MSAEVDAQVREALGRVYDPCSLAANVPVSLIDMGLVRGWALDDEGNLVVRMCVTSGACTIAPHFVRAAESELRKIPQVASVRIDLDASVFWTPEMMTEKGRADLQARRERSVLLTGLRPRQWRDTLRPQPETPTPFVVGREGG